MPACRPALCGRGDAEQKAAGCRGARRDRRSVHWTRGACPRAPPRTTRRAARRRARQARDFSSISGSRPPWARAMPGWACAESLSRTGHVRGPDPGSGTHLQLLSLSPSLRGPAGPPLRGQAWGEASHSHSLPRLAQHKEGEPTTVSAPRSPAVPHGPRDRKADLSFKGPRRAAAPRQVDRGGLGLGWPGSCLGSTAISQQRPPKVRGQTRSSTTKRGPARASRRGSRKASRKRSLAIGGRRASYGRAVLGV